MGSRRAKMPQKHRKKLMNLIFWSAGCSLLRAEGFSCSLDVLYGGQRINKLECLIKKDIKNSAVFFFFSFWSSKPWIRIHLKCWILILILWIRFHSSAYCRRTTVPAVGKGRGIPAPTPAALSRSSSTETGQQSPSHRQILFFSSNCFRYHLPVLNKILSSVFRGLKVAIQSWKHLPYS